MTKEELEREYNFDIVIPVGNGNFLVAVQNADPSYDKEIFVGLIDSRGCWFQDLACVRSAYQYNDSYIPSWKDGMFEVLVYSSEFDEDYTHKFTINEREDDGF